MNAWPRLAQEIEGELPAIDEEGLDLDDLAAAESEADLASVQLSGGAGAAGPTGNTALDRYIFDDMSSPADEGAFGSAPGMDPGDASELGLPSRARGGGGGGSGVSGGA